MSKLKLRLKWLVWFIFDFSESREPCRTCGKLRSEHFEGMMHKSYSVDAP